MKPYMIEKRGSVKRYQKWVDQKKEAFAEEQRTLQEVAAQKKLELVQLVNQTYEMEERFFGHVRPHPALVLMSKKFGISLSAVQEFMIAFAQGKNIPVPVELVGFASLPKVMEKLMREFEDFKKRATIDHVVERVQRTQGFLLSCNNHVYKDDLPRLVRSLCFFHKIEHRYTMPLNAYARLFACFEKDKCLTFMREYEINGLSNKVHKLCLPTWYKRQSRMVLRVDTPNVAKDIILHYTSPVYCYTCHQWSHASQRHPSDPRRASCSCPELQGDENLMVPIMQLTVDAENALTLNISTRVTRVLANPRLSQLTKFILMDWLKYRRFNQFSPDHVRLLELAENEP